MQHGFHLHDFARAFGFDDGLGKQSTESFIFEFIVSPADFIDRFPNFRRDLAGFNQCFFGFN